MSGTGTQTSSAQLVKKATELFNEHGDFLLRIFKREISAQDAHDLWQNLFLSVIANPVPENTANVRGYLYRAAMNDIIDFKRSKEYRQQKMDIYPHVSDRPRKYEDSPDEQLASVETIKKVLNVIEENLPTKISRAMIDKHINNMSHRQIAEKMNLKTKTVNRYLSVGTKKLEQIRDQLIGDEYEQQ